MYGGVVEEREGSFSSDFPHDRHLPFLRVQGDNICVEVPTD